MTFAAAFGSRSTLIASDLDGTLVRSDRTISRRTAQALSRIVERGIGLVLVTGRPIRWMRHVYEQIDVSPLAVCANGAAVWDPVADRIVHEESLAAEVLVEACDRLRAEIPGVLFAVERGGGRDLLFEVGYPIGDWEVVHASVRPAELADMLSEPAAKLLVRAGEQPADRFTARVGAILTGLGEATNSSSSGTVEVSRIGVTKASGLAWVAGSLGVAQADVLAFGDMPNDLPMLAWAGRGVAMRNAHPAVRAVADDITEATNEEDGVAAYLDRLL
jgi:Cof subfamily protein (haloacid dehalogenase superfamily)